MKITLFVVSLIMSLSAFAQKEHLSFMDIPIAGPISEFNKSLRAKGFVFVKKSDFKNYTTKSVKGDWWWFKNCKVTIRQHDACKEVSSIYIHPTSGYTRLYDLIDAYDNKYGKHTEYVDELTNRDFCLTWIFESGSIQIYGSTIFGQAFNIVYRDYTELNAINNIQRYMDSEL